MVKLHKVWVKLLYLRQLPIEKRTEVQTGITTIRSWLKEVLVSIRLSNYDLHDVEIFDEASDFCFELDDVIHEHTKEIVVDLSTVHGWHQGWE